MAGVLGRLAKYVPGTSYKHIQELTAKVREFLANRKKSHQQVSRSDIVGLLEPVGVSDDIILDESKLRLHFYNSQSKPF